MAGSTAASHRARSATADGSGQQLVADRLAAVIDRYVYSGGTHGPADAALRVLADPDVAAGLRALPVLDALRAAHQPRRWAADSNAVTCSCGRGDCDVLDRLGGLTA